MTERLLPFGDEIQFAGGAENGAGAGCKGEGTIIYGASFCRWFQSICRGLYAR